MTRIRRIMAALACTASLTIGGAGIAQASTPDVVTAIPASDGGAASLDGELRVVLDDTANGQGPKTAAVQSVGGGTWHYGYFFGVWPPKTCYSHYKHNGKYHSSTAIMGGQNMTRYAPATAWSRTSVTSGAGHTCRTYWNTY